MAYNGSEEDHPPKLYFSKEDEERLIERLYTQSVNSKKESLQQLESRYYPKPESHKISKEELQKSINRQYDQEIERRKQNFAETEKKAYESTEKENTKTVNRLSKEEIDASVDRLYNETLKKKQQNALESQNKYLFNPEKEVPTKKKDPKELGEYFEKISKPKKQTYTTEEINKIYGLSEGGSK